MGNSLPVRTAQLAYSDAEVQIIESGAPITVHEFIVKSSGGGGVWAITDGDGTVLTGDITIQGGNSIIIDIPTLYSNGFGIELGTAGIASDFEVSVIYTHPGA